MCKDDPQQSSIITQSVDTLADSQPSPAELAAQAGCASTTLHVICESSHSQPSSPSSHSSTPSSLTHVGDAEISGEGREGEAQTPSSLLDIQIAKPPHYEGLADYLSDGANRASKVKTLVSSAGTSFLIFERFLEEKSQSGHSAIASTQPGIKDVAKDYSAAIKTSVETVECGICFADGVARLCDLVLVLQHSDKDISRFMEEMQQIAQRAYSDASNTYTRFRGVRGALMQIVKNYNHQTKDSKTVIQYLQTAIEDLNKLINSVGDFVRWWSQADTTLSSLNISINIQPAPGCDRLSRPRIENFKQDWENLRKDYVEYKDCMSLLEDMYPIDTCATLSWWSSWKKKWKFFFV